MVPLGGMIRDRFDLDTHVCFIHARLKASAKAKAIDVPLAYARTLGAR